MTNTHKLIIGILLFLISLTIIAPLTISRSSVHAQEESPEEVGVGTGPAIVHSMVGMILGCSFAPFESSGYNNWYQSPDGCLELNSEDITAERRFQILKETQKAGAVGNVFEANNFMYENKPSSAIAWFNHETDKINNDSQVLAQSASDTATYRPGLGFNVLEPVYGLWTWSRNITYVLFIVLAIVIAFLILFRSSLGGQNPITIFNSVPSIILSLVLITFSYPISGLFIDVITVGTNLAQNLLVGSPGAPGYNQIWEQEDGVDFIGEEGDGIPDRRQIQPDDIEISIWRIINQGDVELCESEGGALNDDCNLSNLLPTGAIGEGSIAGANLNEFAGNILAGLASFLGGVANPLIQVIVAISILMVSIRLFLQLLNKYLVLILMPLLAPWYFFLGALPSKASSMYSLFIRVHLGAALTFVALYTYFLLIIVIGVLPSISAIDFVPPLLGYDTETFVNSSQNVGRAVIMFALYLGSPAIPQYVNQILEVPDGNMLAQEIGKGISGGFSQLIGIGSFGLGQAQRARGIPPRR
jgi:hypothetical protein